MVVKELIAKLGFQVDAGTIAASDAAIGSARKSLMETSVAADTAGTGMKKFGADAVTAGTEARAAGAEASTAFGARLKASIASSAASMQAFGREVQNIKNQLMGLGMMAVGGFGLFELADGAIETGHQVSQLSQRLRINQDDALQLSRMSQMAGADARQVGTVLTRLDRGFMTAGKNGNETTKTLAEFGVSLTDGNGKLLSYTDQLSALSQAYQKAEEEGTGDEFMTKLFGPRGMSLGPLLMQADELKERVGSIKSTAILDPKAADDAWKSLNTMKAQVGQLALAFGAALIPAVSTFVSVLTAGAQAVAGFIAQHRQLATIIGNVTGAVIAFVAAWKTAQIIISICKAIRLAIASSFLTNPIFWIIAAIAALILIINDLYTWITGGQSVIGSWLGPFSAIYARTVEVYDGIKAGVIDACSAFAASFSNAIETVKGFFSGLLSFALSVLSQIASSIGTYVMDKIKSAKDSLMSFLNTPIANRGDNGGGNSYQYNISQTNNGSDAIASAPDMNTMTPDYAPDGG